MTVATRSFARLAAPLLCGLLAAPAAAFEVDCTAGVTQWSDTTPPLNLTHVFCGEIGSRGDAVGFHAQPDGQAPPTARLLEVEDGPNALGVYTARVEVREPGEPWSAADDKFSSFFPDADSRQTVVDAILDAFADSGAARGKWRGDSGRGYEIEGWLLPDPPARINTAYPIYAEPR
jgi:hypothetical protein